MIIFCSSSSGLKRLHFKSWRTEKQRLILSVSVCTPNQMCQISFFFPSPPTAETHYLLEQEKKKNLNCCIMSPEFRFIWVPVHVAVSDTQKKKVECGWESGSQRTQCNVKPTSGPAERNKSQPLSLREPLTCSEAEIRSDTFSRRRKPWFSGVRMQNETSARPFGQTVESPQHCCSVFGRGTGEEKRGAWQTGLLNIKELLRKTKKTPPKKQYLI